MKTYVFFWYGFLVWVFLYFCYMAIKVGRRTKPIIVIPPADPHMAELYFANAKKLSTKLNNMMVIPYEEWPEDIRNNLNELNENDLSTVADTLQSIVIQSDKRIWSKRRLEIEESVKAQHPNAWKALEEFNKELDVIREGIKCSMNSAMAYHDPLITFVKGEIMQKVMGCLEE